MKKKGGIFCITARYFLFPVKTPAWLKKYFSLLILVLLLCSSATAQNCTLINTIPATPPSSGVLDSLVNATKPGYYSVLGTNIYDSYDINGHGDSTTISPSNLFWINYDSNPTGPLNRCGVWGKMDPDSLGFSVCINIPADKSYYMGFAADNSGTLKIDGQIVLQGLGFYAWGIYKISLTQGKHLVEFKVKNFGGSGALGFEIYDNTKDQITNATSYGDLNIVFSTQNEIGATVEEGDPATSYSCPVGYIPDYCSSTVPTCTQFTPIPVTKPDLGPDINLCFDDSVILSPAPGTFTSYLWQDGSTMPTLKVTRSGTYWVKVTYENGCSASDTVVVKVIGCLPAVIPNTFTPNGDGINDTWKIDGLAGFSNCTVSVYTRWGQLVFKSTGYPKPWDGTSNGKDLPFGTYYYIIDLKNNAPPISGNVTIVR